MTEKITYVEIDLNRCSNTYGISPCTASGPAKDKCFNCFATCQDKNNYNKEIVTSRHSSATSRPPIDIDAIPDLKNYSIRPAMLDLGESIGTRASVTLTFGDSRFPDTGPEGDKYLIDRDYEPYEVGTYWGKFRARFPFIQGADIRLIRGDTTQSLQQMETRHFIVETVTGPDSGGKFTITCKDALKLADSKKAQAPRMSNGEIFEDITASSTSLTLSPAGVGNAEYPASGLVNLGGEEVCTFTRTNDVMNIVRAQFNTDATVHDAGTRVQLCLNYSAQIATNIINDLLVSYANVPSSYIPLLDWNLEDSDNINRTYTALIAEPVSVTDLVNEILQQTASSIWWDDIARLLRFRVLKAVDTSATLYNDDFILAGSFTAKDQNGKRVSQVWTYFGQINPLEDLTNGNNYSRTQITVNPDSETNFEGTPSIKRIYSRWIESAGRDAAQRLNDLILSRYSTPPRLISYTLQRDPRLSVPSLGSGYNVSNRNIQDPKGMPKVMPIQVVQMKSSDANLSIIGEEVLYSDTVAPVDPTVKTVTLEGIGDELSVNMYEAALAGRGGNTPPEEGDTWRFIISEGAVVGSNSAGISAITTGAGWPANTTLKIINNGLISGRGGNGGAGGYVDGLSEKSVIVLDGEDGGNGGNALNAEHPLELENNGTIGGGGGGGGGGHSSGILQVLNGGGGGGGGQGEISSIRGLKATIVANPNSIVYEGSDGTGGNINSSGIGGAGGINPQLSDATGFGGNGGSLGQNGFDGESAENSPELEGGKGGIAGSAIDQNGNTVTITGSGTVLGAINP